MEIELDELEMLGHEQALTGSNTCSGPTNCCNTCITLDGLTVV